MVGSAYIGQLVGRQFGTYLGRQIALGACRDDRDDELARRVFTPRLTPAQIPSAVDLRPWTTPVEDQGQLGSCAANALVGGVEYLVRRETGEHVDLSRLFVYFLQRLWDDCVRDDLGASIGDGVRVLNRLGVPAERSWPYARELFGVQPPEPILREASRTRVVDWWAVPVDADAFRGCLAAGFPIAFGTRVTESFVQTPRSGECGMPAGADDRRHGRHALLAVGYDDRRRVFVVRNSWGQDWGDRGHVYMPYAYVLQREWTSGCWALRLTARDAFDPSEHRGVDLRTLPQAPPGQGGGASMVGGAASIGAQVAVGAFTGSGLLAGLAGGLISGLTPGVSKALRGRDRGAFVGQDRSDAIVAAMRGTPEPPSVERFAWDDGHDEEAIVPAVDRSSAARRVRTSPRASSRGAVTPVAVTPVAAPPVARPVIAPSPAPAPRAPAIDTTRIDALPESIAALWRRDGGLKGPLGAPTHAPVPMEEGPYRGVAVRFADGAMFAWDPPPGMPRAKPIAILARERCFHAWLTLGGDRSPLGWPVAEVEDGPAHTRVLRCARGTIVEHPTHGAHAIHGALFAYWQQMGGLSSDLGAPVADALVPSDPREPQSIRFERGTLFWSPQRGVWRG